MAKFNKYEKTSVLIGQKLKKLRIERGYSSYENFAYENDLPRVQYWRMERGTNFTFKNLLKILEIHKITLSEFFSDIE
ncbi:MAG: helix-turn-helix domain-containing protein [Bacteroidia bacterium]